MFRDIKFNYVSRKDKHLSITRLNKQAMILVTEFNKH